MVHLLYNFLSLHLLHWMLLLRLALHSGPLVLIFQIADSSLRLGGFSLVAIMAHLPPTPAHVEQASPVTSASHSLQLPEPLPMLTALYYPH